VEPPILEQPCSQLAPRLSWGCHLTTCDDCSCDPAANGPETANYIPELCQICVPRQARLVELESPVFQVVSRNGLHTITVGVKMRLSGAVVRSAAAGQQPSSRSIWRVGLPGAGPHSCEVLRRHCRPPRAPTMSGYPQYQPRRAQGSPSVMRPICPIPASDGSFRVECELTFSLLCFQAIPKRVRLSSYQPRKIH
jgi:hypothetical protein